jgi:hypothetical protein
VIPAKGRVVDIVSGTGDVLLGANWYSPECANGEGFRWVTNDAVAYVPAIERIEHRVGLDAEAGFALDPSRPFALAVFDDEDRPIAEVAGTGRQTIAFHLPAGRPKLHVLRFHVRHEANRAMSHDPTTPNFRVFNLWAQPLRPEVVPLAAGFRLGRGGWYGLEDAGDDAFRWVNNDAEIVVTNAAAKLLELDAEPGPGVGSKPFTLTVLDHAGTELARVLVDARRRFSLHLPEPHEVPYSITLHAEGGGATRPGHPRVLNFRVFHIPPA